MKSKLWLAATLLSACSINALVYQCHADVQCGAGGSCVDGACAYASTSCPSGLRFDSTATDGRGGQCTDASDISFNDTDAGDLSANGDLFNCNNVTCTSSNPCLTAACVANSCQTTPLAAGQALGSQYQTAGNCQKLTCDGTGSEVAQADPSNIIDDGNDCTNDICSGLNPTHPPKAAGAPCQNDGGVCNGAGVCSVCVPNTKQCNGTTVQTCDSGGHWQDSMTCPYVCSMGSCTGVCVPGSAGCDGNIVQNCQPDGTWKDGSPCAASTPYCSNGTCKNSPSCGTSGLSCAGGTHSCCESPIVTGGTFNRSNDSNYPATVSDFRLDTFEVSVARFRAFVNAGYGTQANPPAAGLGANPHVNGSGWDSSWNANLASDSNGLITNLTTSCYGSGTNSTWSTTSRDNYPINCVSWYEAFAFCIYDGGRLPTEAEWNYAAAGGSEQRVYPWGATIGASDCNYNCTSSCGLASIQNVGTYTPQGDGKWGQTDLAGNVMEWVLDWSKSPYAITPCNDCADITDNTTYRENRGGNYGSDSTGTETLSRNGVTPSYHVPTMGFRCARAK